jgi:hypothetical protein
MVPRAGLEPACPDERAADFKSAVSTDFTTAARDDPAQSRTDQQARGGKKLEAGVGIEPAYTDLQSAAWPLCHPARSTPIVATLLQRAAKKGEAVRLPLL